MARRPVTTKARPGTASRGRLPRAAAIVLNGVPLDALAVRLGSNRNALYKMMFDARRKLRAALAANGYLDHDDSGRL